MIMAVKGQGGFGSTVSRCVLLPAFILLACANGCAVRWQDLAGEEHMLGAVQLERRGDQYLKRTSLGFIFDFVERSFALGAVAIEDRSPAVTTTRPSSALLSAADGGVNDERPSRRQFFSAAAHRPTGPRLRRESIAGLIVGRTVAGAHAGAGVYDESAFVDIFPSASVLFVAPRGWDRPIDARGWIWRSHEISRPISR